MLTVDIKKQLGLIIKQNRMFKYEEIRLQNPKDYNPYKKEVFCKGICHFHTLTKVENELVQDDNVYRLLLNKLGYSFNVIIEEHISNMLVIKTYVEKLFIAIEYIDDKLIEDIISELSNYDFKNDCIALLHIYLIDFMYKLHFFKKLEDNDIQKLLINKDLFEGIYKGLFYHIMGINCTNKRELEKAKSFFFEAKRIYIQNNLSKGIINSNIMALHLLTREYLNLVNLCLEMENYYHLTNNNNRLLHVYTYLADYYLIINSLAQAEFYHRKRIDLVTKEKSIQRYKFLVDYNWGLHLLENYEYSKALKNIEDAYNGCTIPVRKLQILNVVIFLMIKLNDNEERILNLINEGLSYIEDATEFDKLIFNYFKYKYEKNPYHKKYALNKVIPEMKLNPGRIDFVLLMYEDLYEK